MKKTMLCMLALAAFSSCKKNEFTGHHFESSRPLQIDAVTTSNATAFNSLYTRSAGGGWTGGDIAYSIPLPNNQVLWPMGDTFIDPVNAPDATHPTRYHTNPGLLSSTFAVTSGVGTTAPTWVSTLYNVSGGYPVPYYPPVSSTIRRWSKDGVYHNNKIYAAIFVNQQGPGGPLDIQTVRTDWAEINYNPPSYTVNQIQTRNTNTAIIYGSSVIKDGSYIYIFGTETTTSGGIPVFYMHVARVPTSSPMAAWEYYKGGTTWNTTQTGSYRLKTTSGADLTGISTEYTVFKREGRFYLVAQEPAFLSPDIYRWRTAVGGSITGPYIDKLKLFSASKPSGALLGSGTWTAPDTTWTYSAKAHPEFKKAASGADTAALLVSYNVNNMNFNKVVNNADLYRPLYVWVLGWK